MSSFANFPQGQFTAVPFRTGTVYHGQLGTFYHHQPITYNVIYNNNLSVQFPGHETWWITSIDDGGEIPNLLDFHPITGHYQVFQPIPAPPNAPPAPLIPLISASQQQQQISGTTHQEALVIEDDNTALSTSPSLQPRPRVPSPLPSPRAKAPSDLKERVTLIGQHCRDQASWLPWWRTFLAARSKEKEAHCRKYWPSNDAALADVVSASKYHGSFQATKFQRLENEALQKDAVKEERKVEEVSEWIERNNGELLMGRIGGKMGIGRGREEDVREGRGERKLGIRAESSPEPEPGPEPKRKRGRKTRGNVVPFNLPVLPRREPTPPFTLTNNSADVLVPGIPSPVVAPSVSLPNVQFPDSPASTPWDEVFLFSEGSGGLAAEKEGEEEKEDGMAGLMEAALEKSWNESSNDEATDSVPAIEEPSNEQSQETMVEEGRDADLDSLFGDDGLVGNFWEDGLDDHFRE
ncbi:hypothetical protein CC80DRAFT_499750 [Byssothecium circinans]|uniref:Uncharacterized protein n=1 Tax=Byssothecium circinans TaxID=147558 RepID=A0A6A5UCD4_9PLEO|nr:hypothetical protein CC80DRAFT_499750 [Byssothecium circinans]